LCICIREVFALNLRRARNAKGLSQEELAHEADVDRSYVSAPERSKYGMGQGPKLHFNRPDRVVGPTGHRQEFIPSSRSGHWVTSLSQTLCWDSG